METRNGTTGFLLCNPLLHNLRLSRELQLGKFGGKSKTKVSSPMMGDG